MVNKNLHHVHNIHYELNLFVCVLKYTSKQYNNILYYNYVSILTLALYQHIINIDN